MLSRAAWPIAGSRTNSWLDKPNKKVDLVRPTCTELRSGPRNFTASKGSFKYAGGFLACDLDRRRMQKLMAPQPVGVQPQAESHTLSLIVSPHGLKADISSRAVAGCTACAFS